MSEDRAQSENAIPIELPAPNATRKLGCAIALALSPGDVVGLEGDLGSGKTTLARAIIQALSPWAGEAPSPTFTLVQTYPARVKGRDLEIWHFDLYRVKAPEEAYELAIEDAFADGVSLIEWPSRLGALLPRDCLMVTLTTVGPEARRASLTGDTRWHTIIRGIEKEMRS